MMKDFLISYHQLSHCSQIPLHLLVQESYTPRSSIGRQNFWTHFPWHLLKAFLCTVGSLVWKKLWLTSLVVCWLTTFAWTPPPTSIGVLRRGNDGFCFGLKWKLVDVTESDQIQWYLGRGAVGGSETGWGTAGTGLKPLRMSPSSRTSDVFGTLALLVVPTWCPRSHCLCSECSSVAGSYFSPSSGQTLPSLFNYLALQN